MIYIKKRRELTHEHRKKCNEAAQNIGIDVAYGSYFDHFHWSLHKTKIHLHRAVLNALNAISISFLPGP